MLSKETASRLGEEHTGAPRKMTITVVVLTKEGNGTFLERYPQAPGVRKQGLANKPNTTQ